MAMQGRRKQARAGIAAGQRQNSQLSWPGLAARSLSRYIVI